MKKTKGDFILDLLSNNKLSVKDREKVLSLSAKEFDKNSDKYKEMILEIDKIKNSIKSLEESSIKNLTPTNDIKHLYHKPKEITKFLNNFKENTALKFSTHIWDKTDFLESYMIFINKLNEEKKHYKFNSLFNYSRPLYNLLNYFLFKPQVKILNNGIPEYGWNAEELKEIKIGWQYPSILEQWSNENTQEGDSKQKFPLEMKIPLELKPIKRVKGKEINTFEDVANIFKTEIQFRHEENNLFKEIEFYLKNQNLNNSDNSIHLLKNLDFYTYTRGVVNAIQSILRLFVKENESYKNVSFQVDQQNDFIIIYITQLNSFPDKSIDFEKIEKFFGGDSLAIINHLFSLCDYSIISRFNEKDYLEIEILNENSFGVAEGNNLKKLESKFITHELNPLEVTGYTHKLKFYV